MNGLVRTLVVLSAALTCAEALWCYFCLNMQASEASQCDNPGYNNELLMECPTPPAGHEMFCAKYHGKISGSSEGIQVRNTALARECMPIPTGNGTEAKCYTDEAALNLIKSLKPADFNFVQDFKGQMCLCNDENGCNGVGSIQPLAWLLGMLLISAHVWII